MCILFSGQTENWRERLHFKCLNFRSYMHAKCNAKWSWIFREVFVFCANRREEWKIKKKKQIWKKWRKKTASTPILILHISQYGLVALYANLNTGISWLPAFNNFNCVHKLFCLCECSTIFTQNGRWRLWWRTNERTRANQSEQEGTRHKWIFSCVNGNGTMTLIGCILNSQFGSDWQYLDDIKWFPFCNE